MNVRRSKIAKICELQDRRPQIDRIERRIEIAQRNLSRADVTRADVAAVRAETDRIREELAAIRQAQLASRSGATQQ